jgi:hypothetical protein
MEQKQVLSPSHIISTVVLRDEESYQEFIRRHCRDHMRLVASSPSERKIEVVITYDSSQ